jgi:hypothetical protein
MHEYIVIVRAPEFPDGTSEMPVLTGYTHLCVPLPANTMYSTCHTTAVTFQALCQLVGQSGTRESKEGGYDAPKESSGSTTTPQAPPIVFQIWQDELQSVWSTVCFLLRFCARKHCLTVF